MARRTSLLALVLIAAIAGAASLGVLSYIYGPAALSRLTAEDAVSPVAVAPGFVGASIFGDWELLCTPGPERAAPAALDKPDSAIPVSTESACRVRHEAIAASLPAPAPGAQTPPQVILTVSLSLVGPTKRPALMLRLPATLKTDDVVMLRNGDSFAIDAVVRECDEEECMAADSLTDEEWMRLVGAGALQVVFPFDETQLVSVDVGVEGLPAAVAALIEAQTN